MDGKDLMLVFSKPRPPPPPCEIPCLANEATQVLSSKQSKNFSPWVHIKSSLQSYNLCSFYLEQIQKVFLTFIAIC